MKINSIVDWEKNILNDNLVEKYFSKNNKNNKDLFKKSMTFTNHGFFSKFGVGANFMNSYSVSLFANSISKLMDKKQKILIGHDNRNNGILYTKIIANILSKKGHTIFFYNKNKAMPSTIMSYTIKSEKINLGIYIGGENHDKNYSGIKLYDELGGDYSHDNYLKLNSLIQDMKEILIDNQETKNDIKFIENDKIKNYINANIKSIKLNNLKNNIKIIYTPLQGTGGKIMAEVLEKSQQDYFIVKKQFNEDPSFSKSKSIDTKISKAYKKVYRMAARKKADIGFATDSESKNIGFFVKYKKRYKFLKNNEIAAVYLKYKLSLLKKENKIEKNAYVLKSKWSGNLIDKIASKYNVKVIETDLLNANIGEIIKNEKGKMILAINEREEVIIDSSISLAGDSTQALIGIIDACAFYKSNKSNLYSELKKIWKEFGISRVSKKNKEISIKQFKNIVSKIEKNKKIYSLKVKKIDLVKGFEKQSIFYNVIFENNSSLLLKYNREKNEANFLVESQSNIGQKLMDIVIIEKEIYGWINDNCETFENKKWSWKGFLKYVIFVLIIVGIMAFVFLIIYKDSNKVDSSSGKSSVLTPYSMASIIINSGTTRIIWLSLLTWTVATKILSAWKLKRMLMMQCEKVHLRHLLIGQIMGSVISFVTPFTIGGDAIGYWYMRRKGIARAPLIATYMSDTLLFQAKFTLQTIILVTIGYPIYQQIFQSGDYQSSAALIWFLLGTGWTIFATTMIFTLTLSKRFQEFCIRNALKLLEWTKFIPISDPGFLLAKYQYEFYSIRKGMRVLWTKWWFPFEMMFYYLLPLFVSPTTMLLMSTGWIKQDISGVNGYIGVIVINDIIGTANSMSLTPGGSGTGEWLTIVTKKMIYNTENYGGKYTSSGIASAGDLLGKVLYWWPILVFSTLLISTIVPLENYRNKQNIRKVKKLKSVYLIVWISFLAGYLVYFFMIFR